VPTASASRSKLDVYEALLRDFSDLPRDLKLEAMREVKDLRGLVGTIDVQGAEPEASIAIDGIPRGAPPALALILLALASRRRGSRRGALDQRASCRVID
jgi:hypothetical protein